MRVGTFIGSLLVVGYVGYKLGKTEGTLETMLKVADGFMYGHSPDRKPWKSYQKPFQRERPSRYLEALFQEKEEAKIVLTKLEDLIKNYGQATLKELYDLIGHPSDHTHDKLGWFNVDDAVILYLENTYQLRLPKPIELD